jgi:hypothetical protein
MTRNNKSIAAGIGAVVGAILLVGTMASPASARWGDRDERWGDREERRSDHNERWGERHGWNGNYYRPPPVVYGGYGDRYGYYPPPVVYGRPGFGIQLPGVNLNIR